MKMRILKLTPETFVRVLQGKAFASNLPNDLELLDVKCDLSTREVVAIVRSDSFENIEENCTFPEFKLTTSSLKTQATPNAVPDLKPAEVKVSQKVKVQLQQSQDTGKLEEEFSPDQRKLLRFMVDGEYVIVKPLQFLKAEWEDINDVVKSLGGRWVKGDIINYWEIPKKQT